MIIRIKVEEYYEVEVPDGPIDAIKNMLETGIEETNETYFDKLLREKGNYVGGYFYFENANNFLFHDYTQLDVY